MCGFSIAWLVSVPNSLGVQGSTAVRQPLCQAHELLCIGSIQISLERIDVLLIATLLVLKCGLSSVHLF